MANLLNKTKKIERTENTEPKDTYNPNNVFTVKQNEKKETRAKEKKTTIRLSYKNQQRLNALVTQNSLDSVDQVLDLILNQYESGLSKEQRKELDTIIKIYSKKQ
ncbi:hypothetical protein [Bacillus massiliglaciei]|uniref:hypothetical protein n=1 Tax=Bacillus massiliglaciei TaxID=1816693 RepID=UPI000DA60199|nr:hypothetical protein [Bacillus massiliglaciei]